MKRRILVAKAALTVTGLAGIVALQALISLAPVIDSNLQILIVIGVLGSIGLVVSSTYFVLEKELEEKEAEKEAELERYAEITEEATYRGMMRALQEARLESIDDTMVVPPNNSQSETDLN